eukprot:2238726-Pyramimonas_sp.AAC.1
MARTRPPRILHQKLPRCARASWGADAPVALACVRDAGLTFLAPLRGVSGAAAHADQAGPRLPRVLPRT